MYAVTPLTPEGHLIRDARKRKRLRMDELARKVGVSKEKLGYMERGYDDDRKPYAYEDDAALARIAAETGIPAAELERTGHPGAAELLRSFPVPPQEPAPSVLSPDAAALGSRLFALLIADRPDREVLEFLLRGEKPLADRVQAAIDWLEDRPASARAERARETG